MKNFKAVILCAALLCAILSGCSSDSGGSSDSSGSAAAVSGLKGTTISQEQANALADITGVWKSVSFISSEGSAYTAEAYAENKNVKTDDVLITYTFDRSGSVVCSESGSDNKGTYSFDGLTVQITFDNTSTSLEYSSDDNRIVEKNRSDGYNVVFVKETTK